MKKGGLLLIFFFLSLHVISAPIESEMVWLKDVTTSLQTDKREFSDTNLPDDLIFQLRGGSRALTLNLKRNHGIDPNADVYYVRKSNDGRSYVEKVLNLEKEDLAYYQDRNNGAFMTVKCVKRSNGQCDRVINGNILIEDRNYDLQPARTDITSRDFFDVSDLLGTRYVLRDQANGQRDISVTHKDETTFNEEHVEQEVTGKLRRFQNGQKHFPYPNSMYFSRKEVNLHKRNTPKHVYYVEIAVMVDFGVWEFYYSLMMQANNALVQPLALERRLREVFSHIINGVNLRYSTIDDRCIEIRITLREIYILQRVEDFAHTESVVENVGGRYKIDVTKYVYDLALWASVFGNFSDHVMLFSRYELFDSNIGEVVNGYSYLGEVCDTFFKTSVILAGDYFFTMVIAAHELGHNLGTHHDGEGNAINCRAEDHFIMSPFNPVFNESEPYSRHPWVFSNCSVDVFKNALKNKTCLQNVGVFYNMNEWSNFMKKLPGQIYSANVQCEFINGPESKSCGKVLTDICRFMQCTDPINTLCNETFYSAARGTECGSYMLYNDYTQPEEDVEVWTREPEYHHGAEDSYQSLKDNDEPGGPVYTKRYQS